MLSSFRVQRLECIEFTQKVFLCRIAYRNFMFCFIELSAGTGILKTNHIYKIFVNNTFREGSKNLCESCENTDYETLSVTVQGMH